MREILFRGKRKDNGEWATATSIFKAEHSDELHFYINSLSSVTVYFNCDGNITRTEAESDCEWLEVIQETVGQFTGLTDKNGKKIFEGDIIRAKIESGNHEGFTWPNMPVGFQEGSFCLNDRKGYVFCVLGAFAPSVTLEVIGNIHDNPELLEERQ